MASRDDLPCEGEDLFLITFEEVLLDVLLKVTLAVLKEEVKVVGGLLNIKELHNVWMLETLQSFVLLLNSLHEICKIGLQHLLDILLLDHLARTWLLVIFVLVGLISSRKATSTQTLIHLYVVIPHSLVLLFHINNIRQTNC